MEFGDSSRNDLAFFPKTPCDDDGNQDYDDQKHREAGERERGARRLGFRSEGGEVPQRVHGDRKQDATGKSHGNGEGAAHAEGVADLDQGRGEGLAGKHVWQVEAHGNRIRH